MNHKKKRAKNQRAGCLLCKPNKMNGWNKDMLGHTGFSKLAKSIAAKEEIKEYQP